MKAFGYPKAMLDNSANLFRPHLPSRVLGVHEFIVEVFPLTREYRFDLIPIAEFGEYALRRCSSCIVIVQHQPDALHFRVIVEVLAERQREFIRLLLDRDTAQGEVMAR